jgi:hypothetical protein
MKPKSDNVHEFSPMANAPYYCDVDIAVCPEETGILRCFRPASDDIHNVAARVEVALAPCPCCGWTPERICSPHCFNGTPGWRIRCDKCGLKTAWWHSPEEANGAWNARVDLQEAFDATRKALIGLSLRQNRKDKMPYCWCNSWDWTRHSQSCAAARTALALTGEGGEKCEGGNHESTT